MSSLANGNTTPLLSYPPDQNTLSSVTDVDSSHQSPSILKGWKSFNEVLQNAPRPERWVIWSNKISAVVHSPSVIILGQLLLLGFAWGFYGAIIFYGNITLPDTQARYAKAFPQVVTIMVTLLATALSLFSTLLFANAVRHLLNSKLSRPISLFALSASIELSKTSFVFNLYHIKWTIITLVCSIALNTLTSGWTTLLTPTTVTIEKSITGTEIDVGSAGFSSLLTQRLDFVESNPTALSVSVPSIINALLSASGSSAAIGQFGSPNLFNFNRASYNISTGGILATGPSNVHDVGADTFLSTQMPIRYQVQNGYTHSSGISSNFTMVQQGFTANVSCQRRRLSPTTKPSLERNFTTIDIGEVLGVNQTLQIWDWQTQCPDGSANNNTGLITLEHSPGGGFVVSLVCSHQASNGSIDPSNHYLILHGEGDGYSLITTTICEIIPKITTLRVDYGTSVNISYMYNSANLSLEAMGVGQHVVQSVADLVTAAQNVRSNTIGDSIAGIFWSRGESNNGTTEEQVQVLNTIVENYIRGVVEFYGTWLRMWLSRPGAFPNDEIPSNMTVSTHGTLRIETMGWGHQSTTSLLALIPTTFVALFTIVITLISLWARHVDEGKTQRKVHFNPGNPLHLVIASSAGGLNDTFEGYGDTDISHSQSLKVRLGVVDGSRIGFLQEDLKE